MAIDYDALLTYPIPDMRQTLRRQDAAFYALSVGLGEDPMDPRQLDFVDPQRALRALPSMAVVLADPGFWLARPDTGIDATRVLHGEQRIELRKPLPVEGELASRSRVTALVDQGPGRGALLYKSKELRDAVTGETLAIASSTSVLRGAGGFDGPKSAPLPTPRTVLPDTPPDLVVDLPTRPEQALYYRLNGDDNPLHSNPDVAARAGFPRPILHGLCTFGVIAHALLRALADYDPTRLRDMSLRFTAPVYPGETIRTEIWPAIGAFRARVLERDVIVANKGRVVLG